jgi:hypothetical protein
MSEIKYKTFVGTGVFPLDMLRYDHCFPKSQVDVNAIYESIIHEEEPVPRQVTVGNHYGYFSLLQWAVFGWAPYEAKQSEKQDLRVVKPIDRD